MQRVLLYYTASFAFQRVLAATLLFDFSVRCRLILKDMITVTKSAFHQLHFLIAENPEYRDKGLRIFVESGGCAGMQYGMQFDHAKQGDHRIECDGVEVLVDAHSADFLKGATVDFSDGLTGIGFKITNPNAVRSCGCGSSFEAPREV